MRSIMPVAVFYGVKLFFLLLANNIGYLLDDHAKGIDIEATKRENVNISNKEPTKFQFSHFQINSWPTLQASTPRALSERNFVSLMSTRLFQVEFYFKVETRLIMGEISILECRKDIFRNLSRTLYIFFKEILLL